MMRLALETYQEEFPDTTWKIKLNKKKLRLHISVSINDGDGVDIEGRFFEDRSSV